MCIHCVVKGRVQGVWFRQSALEKARELKITGWVKNLKSGEVEVMACGDEAALEAFKRWLWQGPQHAEVAEVIIENATEQNFPDFTIKR